MTPHHVGVAFLWTGITLNVLGVALSVRAVVHESRRKGAPLGPIERMRAWRVRAVRRFRRQRRKSVAVSGPAATFNLEGRAKGEAWEPVDDDMSDAEKLNAVILNLEKLIGKVALDKIELSAKVSEADRKARRRVTALQERLQADHRASLDIDSSALSRQLVALVLIGVGAFCNAVAVALV